MKIIEFYGFKPNVDLSGLLNVDSAVRYFANRQKEDGGFPSIDKSDVETTYHTLLALHLMNGLSKIDEKKCKEFLFSKQYKNDHVSTPLLLFSLDLLDAGRELGMKHMENYLRRADYLSWQAPLFFDEHKVMTHLVLNKFKQHPPENLTKKEYQELARSVVPEWLRKDYERVLNFPERIEERQRREWKFFTGHVDPYKNKEEIAMHNTGSKISSLVIVGNVLGFDLSQYSVTKYILKTLSIAINRLSDLGLIVKTRSALKVLGRSTSVDNMLREKLRKVKIEDEYWKQDLGSSLFSLYYEKEPRIVQLANLLAKRN